MWWGMVVHPEIVTPVKLSNGKRNCGYLALAGAADSCLHTSAGTQEDSLKEESDLGPAPRRITRKSCWPHAVRARSHGCLSHCPDGRRAGTRVRLADFDVVSGANAPRFICIGGRRER